MNHVYIGLGGNSPGTFKAFLKTREILEKILLDVQFSSVYRTIPMLDTDQDDFWNAVANGYWSGSPEGLLERLLMVESGAGRCRDANRPKGPRILDLDLLLVGHEIRKSNRLILPHPGIFSRRFVLEPLLELDSQAVNPVTGTPWKNYLKSLKGQGVDRTDLKW